MPEDANHPDKAAQVWRLLVEQARVLSHGSTTLTASLRSGILQRPSFADGLGSLLARALSGVVPSEVHLRPVFDRVLRQHPRIVQWAALDLEKLEAINPACPDLLTGFLSFRGFQALQLYRINHALMGEGQEQLAILLQNWGAITFSMDIHPGARIGHSIFLDHGIGLVIGSTAVVEDGVNIWHGVTLGSTLTQAGDRHPKIRRNATICAGATILGNIEVGEGALVAAGSVVLKTVPPRTVVAGVPAKVVAMVPERLDAIDEATKRTTSNLET